MGFCLFFLIVNLFLDFFTLYKGTAQENSSPIFVYLPKYKTRTGGV